MGRFFFAFIWKIKLTRRLSEVEILNDATLIVDTWAISRLFANIFHHLNFSKERDWQFSYFFMKNRDYDFRKNRILIMIQIPIWRVSKINIETKNASDQNSSIPFLRYEFSKISGIFHDNLINKDDSYWWSNLKSKIRAKYQKFIFVTF